MAKLKVKFRLAARSVSGEGKLFFQVVHDRVARQVSSNYKLFPYEWDETRSEVVIPEDTKPRRKAYLMKLKVSLAEDIMRWNTILSRLEAVGKPFTADMIMSGFRSLTSGTGFISFSMDIIRQLAKSGSHVTSERYLTTIISFTRFREGQDLLLGDFDSNLMLQYENYLKTDGKCPNTISFYMRNLRAIFNRAVESGLIPPSNPFKRVYTGIEKTSKRGVSLSVMRKIRNLDLSANPELDFARDIFMFSFYTRGMSFVDIAFLKKKDLQNGVLVYRRQKTNQKLYVKWEKQMQKIVDKYNDAENPYLFPIIKQDKPIAVRRQYKNTLRQVNYRLKKVGEKAATPIPLTSYVARHGWASIARSKNIPIAVISEAMGHDSEETTRIYLSQLDASIVDRANHRILNLL